MQKCRNDKKELFHDQPFQGDSLTRWLAVSMSTLFNMSFGNEEYSSGRLWTSVLRRMLGKNIEVDIIYLAFMFVFFLIIGIMYFKIDHTEICRIVKTVWRTFDIRYDSLCIRTITKFWLTDLIQINVRNYECLFR